jgi:hypothetical protein
MQKLARIVLSISVIMTIESSGSIVGGFQFHPASHGVTKNSCLASPNVLRISSQIVTPQVEPSSEASAETELQVLTGIVPLSEEDVVPSTMRDALRIFFLTGDFGPLLVIVSILTATNMRIQLSSLEMSDVIVFAVTLVFWSFQEHFLHEKVLHSKMDWIGKDIHQGHHEKPFYHISIESAPLLLGWMFTAHVILRALLPYSLALTATIAYSLSGMFYEWVHYIVHTKVRFRSNYWRRVKENHVRHHMVSDHYWFAFTMPVIDDLFNTNPPVRKVKHQLNEEKLRNEEQQSIHESR